MNGIELELVVYFALVIKISGRLPSVPVELNAVKYLHLVVNIIAINADISHILACV